MGRSYEVIWAAQEIVKRGLVKGTWGNVSVREKSTVWITPSGVPYDKLDHDSVAVVDLKTEKQIGGKYKYSSELPMHLAIYRSIPEINAVVHTHSVYASVFAVLERPIPCLTEEQAQIIGGEVDVAEYAPPGTEELARNVVEVLKTGKFAALLSKHGAVAIGRTINEALVAAEILEKSAQIALLALTIDREVKPLERDDVERLREIYQISYSKHIIEG